MFLFYYLKNSLNDSEMFYALSLGRSMSALPGPGVPVLLLLLMTPVT